MTAFKDVEEVEALFEELENRATDEDVESTVKLPTTHLCRDLAAMLLIATIKPTLRHNVLSAAEHDIIYFDLSVEEIVDLASKEQVCELYSYGVHLEDGMLAKFV